MLFSVHDRRRDFFTPALCCVLLQCCLHPIARWSCSRQTRAPLPLFFEELTALYIHVMFLPPLSRCRLSLFRYSGYKVRMVNVPTTMRARVTTEILPATVYTSNCNTRNLQPNSGHGLPRRHSYRLTWVCIKYPVVLNNYEGIMRSVCYSQLKHFATLYWHVRIWLHCFPVH